MPIPEGWDAAAGSPSIRSSPERVSVLADAQERYELRIRAGRLRFRDDTIAGMTGPPRETFSALTWRPRRRSASGRSTGTLRPASVLAQRFSPESNSPWPARARAHCRDQAPLGRVGKHLVHDIPDYCGHTGARGSGQLPWPSEGTPRPTSATRLWGQPHRLPTKPPGRSRIAIVSNPRPPTRRGTRVKANGTTELAIACEPRRRPLLRLRNIGPWCGYNVRRTGKKGRKGHRWRERRTPPDYRMPARTASSSARCARTS